MVGFGDDSKRRGDGESNGVGFGVPSRQLPLLQQKSVGAPRSQKDEGETDEETGEEEP